MSYFLRQFHRWTSIAFTLTVVANFVFMGMNPGQQPPAIVTFSPLLPLFLLWLTGLYMFALPYVVKFRSGRRSVRIMKKLSPAQRDALLKTLKARFEKHMNRHKGLDWAKVQARLDRQRRRTVVAQRDGRHRR